MKAYVTASFPEPALVRLRRHMDVVHEDWRQTNRIFFDAEEFAAKLEEVGADVLIVEADFAMGDFFDRVDLALIGSCRGDPNNVDMAQATAHGVPVLFTPGRNADAVADLTMGLMLDLLRNITTVSSRLKAGEFQFDSPGAFLDVYNRYGGAELNGLTVGVVGFGAIGRLVVERLRAFRARIVVHDPFVPAEAIEAAGAQPAPLERTVAEADVLTLHCPPTKENHGLISRELIASMKPGAYFLNLARAVVVDDDALYEALRDGRLAGAGLDVLAEEPAKAENRFVQLDNVIVLPHLGGATRDVARHQSDIVLDDLEAWLRGERPKHIANPEVLEKT